jgi:hypothetical protein
MNPAFYAGAVIEKIIVDKKVTNKIFFIIKGFLKHKCSLRVLFVFWLNAVVGSN